LNFQTIINHFADQYPYSETITGYSRTLALQVHPHVLQASHSAEYIHF